MRREKMGTRHISLHKEKNFKNRRADLNHLFRHQYTSMFYDHNVLDRDWYRGTDVANELKDIALNGKEPEKTREDLDWLERHKHNSTFKRINWDGLNNSKYWHKICNKILKS